MLICRDVTELTTDYLDDALPWVRRLAMSFHLSICKMCRRHLRQVRASVILLGRVGAPAPGTAVEDAVLASLTLAPQTDVGPPPS